jgi:hypothetical protein
MREGSGKRKFEAFVHPFDFAQGDKELGFSFMAYVLYILCGLCGCRRS